MSPTDENIIAELEELEKQYKLSVNEDNKIVLATKAFELINQLLESE
jgi:hypothetical protein